MFNNDGFQYKCSNVYMWEVGEYLVKYVPHSPHPPPPPRRKKPLKDVPFKILVKHHREQCLVVHIF